MQPNIPADIAADQDREHEAYTKALVKLQQLFAADPERVADFFAMWTLTFNCYEFITGAGFEDPALGAESYHYALCEIAGVLGFATMVQQGYGDEDASAEGCTGMRYTLAEDAREGIAKLGARRWVERFLPKGEGPQPRTDAVEAAEVARALDFSTVGSLDHAMALLADLAGTGETPRPLDRTVVAEVVVDGLVRELRTLQAKLSEVTESLVSIETVVGKIRDLLAHNGR